MSNDKKTSKQRKRGPDPETVKIEGGWLQAVKKALKKPRPKTGWPKE